MNSLSPPGRQPHPLALELIERLKSQPGARVREVGTGSGRNRDALLSAGFRVNESHRYDAALSTHALLHGRRHDVAQAVAEIVGALESAAPFFATFGSRRDSRFGRGIKTDGNTYAPESGDEAGVLHCYFNEPELRALLEPHVVIESLQETAVDRIAGTWAHSLAPLRGAVHWFVRARTR